MSSDKKEKKAPGAEKAAPVAHVPNKAPRADKVENSGPSKCAFEECKKSIEKFGFCAEHYELYMAGVIRGDGKKPIDFEAKMSRFAQQKQRKVA